MISRRRVLQSSGAFACACGAPHAWASEAHAPAITPALQRPAFSAVALNAGPMRDQLVHQRDLFMSLADDTLLKPFRLRAGLDAPGEDMGGWYDQSADFHVDPNDWSTANWHSFIPGHSFGQYLSGLSRIYAASGDRAVHDKVERLVSLYARTISPRFFNGYTLPCYVYDKLVVGLSDAYHCANVSQAKDALDRMTDAALPFLPDRALTREERRQLPYTSEAQIWDEPYTLPENLFLAWQRGLGERYRTLALRFVQDGPLFTPLANGVSPFQGKHAYSHVNALSSAVQTYLSTGEQKYLDAARNGFAFVEAQAYATGGWGPNEELLAPDDQQTAFNMLSETHRTFETPCGAYAHFKITRSLLQITKDSRYGDSMERMLYNTILGATPTQPDGRTFYYADYNTHARKEVRDGMWVWPCCSGTFIQLTADYATSAYLLDDTGIYVNLYAPSRVTAPFAGHDVALVQETAYPLANTTRLRMETRRPTTFALRLRIPAWAGPATRITVNGAADATPLTPGTFASIERNWSNGDTIEISFDFGLRLEPLNTAHPDTVALLTGPLVLFPIDAPEAPLSRAQWLAASRRNETEWEVSGANAPITLKPFMAIQNETYRLYSRVA